MTERERLRTLPTTELRGVRDWLLRERYRQDPDLAAGGISTRGDAAGGCDGVIDGLEYLRIATLGLPYPDHKGKRVVVIGGGFTSMDCSRTSVRQGCIETTLVYRRDMKDMPAADEVHEMLEEGARAIFQASPTRVVTDESGKVTGVEFQLDDYAAIDRRMIDDLGDDGLVETP